MKRLLSVTAILFFSAVLHAQTNTDGLMMPAKIFCGGFMYGNDQWTNYWEGPLKRDNENIGTITTQSVMFMGTYGVSSKLNVTAMVPYIWTKASGGTLHGMSGVQDLTISAKYRLLRHESETGILNFFGVLSLAAPMSNYSPDFFPLSLGTHSKRISYRATANYAFKNGIYINASGAYTWRSNVTLDRPGYYTGTSQYYSDQVYMSNTFDFIADIGYHKGPLQVEAYYTQQNTLGGSDIRRQDMPFVSNRMNFSRVGGLVMYYLPFPKNMAVRGNYSYVVDGRNVGQSSTISAGFLYTIYFTKDK